MPEQQSASGEQHPQSRAQQRIQADHRVVGQKNQPQQSEHSWVARGFACHSEVQPPITLFRLANELDYGAEQGGQKQHTRHQQSTEPCRSRTKQPASCQQGK